MHIGCRHIISEDGTINPRAQNVVQNMEEIGQALNIPASNYLSELFGVACGIGLAFMEHNRRKNEKAAGTLIRAVEESADGLLKKRISERSKKDGTEETINEKVRKYT